MTWQNYGMLLDEPLKTLSESIKWLKRSYMMCKKIVIREKYSAEDFNAFEMLADRFSRTVDIIIQKVLRAIDRLETEDEGTLQDVLNRSHKRGLIDSIEEIRLIRELRNDVIVHEHAVYRRENLFGDVMSNVQKVLDMAERINRYCLERYLDQLLSNWLNHADLIPAHS